MPLEPPSSFDELIDQQRPTIRLVAVDLDGTLLDDRKQIGRPTAEALACLPGLGVKLVIASARPPRSVRAIHQALRLDTLCINYNGALIWDPGANRAVFHRPLAAQVSRNIIDYARQRFNGVLVTCEILDRWYTDRSEQPFTTETGRLFQPDVVAPLETFAHLPVTKLLLLGEREVILRLENELLEHFGSHATILRTEENLLQIMDKRVSKAVALKKVATHYGLELSQVMAIGDAPNDVGMIRAAGVGVAMDNAHPLVKEAADWIAPSNNDHGVRAALRKYGLCA